MSTDYRIAPRPGVRITKAKIKTLLGAIGWIRGEETDWKMSMSDGINHLWFYRTGKQAFHSFTRFGGNDPEAVIEVLNEAGCFVYSEHEEEYYK